MPDSTEKTVNKHIRVRPEQWERIEQAAQGSALTANQLVIELAIKALDRRKWPSTETEIKVARASLFAAQVLARDLIANGCEHEVQEIREFISTIVPDPDSRPPIEKTTTAITRGTDPPESTAQTIAIQEHDSMDIDLSSSTTGAFRDFIESQASRDDLKTLAIEAGVN